jgi:hypothetical protein
MNPNTDNPSTMKKIKLSPAMKDVIRKLRSKKPKYSLFWNYAYRAAFLDQEHVNRKTFDALCSRLLIHGVVNVALFDRYELTKLGKTISL